MQDVVNAIREPLLIMDDSLRVHSANRAFYQTFHVCSEETAPPRIHLALSHRRSGFEPIEGAG
jgi:nitrogen-specific signal transduction histidine kinase